jgi:hypothetical protein
MANQFIDDLPPSDLAPESDRLIVHKKNQGTHAVAASSFIQNFSSLSFTLLPEERLLKTVENISDEEISIKLPNIYSAANSALVNFESYPYSSNSSYEYSLRFRYYNNSNYSGGHQFRQSYTVKHRSYINDWHDSHRIWLPVVDGSIYLKLSCTNKIEIKMQGYS